MNSIQVPLDGGRKISVLGIPLVIRIHGHDTDGGLWGRRPDECKRAERVSLCSLHLLLSGFDLFHLQNPWRAGRRLRVT